jgi:hypothetical protein
MAGDTLGSGGNSVVLVEISASSLQSIAAMMSLIDAQTGFPGRDL